MQREDLWKDVRTWASATEDGGSEDARTWASATEDGKQEGEAEEEPERIFEHIRSALTKIGNARDTSNVQKWETGALTSLMNERAEWWPSDAAPASDGEIGAQLSGDGYLRLARKTARAKDMTLNSFQWEMGLSKVNVFWLIPGTLAFVPGNNVNGHGFGVAVYETEAATGLSTAYIQLIKF